MLRRSDKPFYSHIGAAGDEFEALYCKIHYESNCPFYGDQDTFYNNRFDTFAKQNCLWQDGKAVYKFAVNAMADAVRNVAEQGGYSIDDLDIVIPHQANNRQGDRAAGYPLGEGVYQYRVYGQRFQRLHSRGAGRAAEVGKDHRGHKAVLCGLRRGSYLWRYYS